MVSHLWPASQAWSLDGAPASNQTFGVQWVSTQNGWLNRIRFFMPSGFVSGDVPANLRVYRVYDQFLLTLIAVPSSAVVAGWNDITLQPSLAVQANVAYIAAIDLPSGGRYVQPSPSSGATPSPDSPLAINGVGKPINATTWGYPNITAGFYTGVDVTWDATAEVPPGGTTQGSTTGDVNNTLASWLSTTDGTHSDSAPLQDHSTLATVRNVVGSTSGQLDATKAVSDAIHDLLTATNKNLGTLWDLAGHLTDLEIAAWQSFFGAGTARITGPNSAGGSAFYTADGQLVSQLVAEIWQRTLVLRNELPFGVAPWSMSDETDFADSIAFAQPADAYVLNITSWQDTQPADEVSAGLWLPRIGWWCVLTGTLASQRNFVDFEHQMLSDGGRRMAGCAIQLKPGTLATVQAWLLA